MQGERGLFIPQEAMRVGETQIRVASSITPNELFGRTLRDGRNLALTTNPLYMFEAVREGSAPEKIVVLPPLYGQQFWHFINTIAPLPYEMRIDGVIYDWGMPDREHGSGGRLTRHEGSMGEDWDIFERSRHIFIDTLKFDPVWQRRSLRVLVRDFLRIDYNLERPFTQEIVATFEEDSELREGFVTFLQGRGRFKNRKWLNAGEIDQIENRVSNWDSYEDRALGIDFLIAALKDPDMKGRESVVGLYNNAFNTGASLDLVDGKAMLTMGDSLKGELTFFSDRGGKTGWTMNPEIFTSANFLLPTIRWTRNDDGKVILNFDFLDEALADSILPHVVSLPGNLHFDTRRLNPVAGVGVPPYLIRTLKNDWPEYQKIIRGEGGNYQVLPAHAGESGAQFMSAQASLVVALQHKEEIAQNEEFFDKAEDHLRQHAA